MKLLGRLIRNYYEINGSFDGIYNKLGKLLVEQNLSMSDLYKFLGYKDSNPLHSSYIYMVRKAIIQGQKDKVKQISQMDYDKANEFVVSNDLPIFSEFKKPHLKYREYIELLSNYMKHSRNNVNEQGDFRQYLHELSQQPLNIIAKTLESKDFKETATAIMPTWKCVEGVEPVIQLGVFYTPVKLSSQDKKYIQEQALKNAILNTLNVAEEYALVIKSVVKDQFTELYNYNYEGYRAICDLAIFQNMSIQELLNSCNLNIVDYTKQYIEHRCIFYMKNDEIILTATNGKEEADIILSKQHFKNLYESGNLDYLTVSSGKIFVNKDKLIPINKVI